MPASFQEVTWKASIDRASEDKIVEEILQRDLFLYRANFLPNSIDFQSFQLCFQINQTKFNILPGILIFSREKFQMHRRNTRKYWTNKKIDKNVESKYDIRLQKKR